MSGAPLDPSTLRPEYGARTVVGIFRFSHSKSQRHRREYIQRTRLRRTKHVEYSRTHSRNEKSSNDILFIFHSTIDNSKRNSLLGSSKNFFVNRKGLLKVFYNSHIETNSINKCTINIAKQKLMFGDVTAFSSSRT